MSYNTKYQIVSRFSESLGIPFKLFILYIEAHTVKYTNLNVKLDEF